VIQEQFPVAEMERAMKTQAVRRAWAELQLHVGEDDAARSRSGGAAQEARLTPQTAATAAVAGSELFLPPGRFSASRRRATM
jgi:hypothetical protein